MGVQILSATGLGQGPTLRSLAQNHGVVVTITSGITALQFQLLGRIAGCAWVPLTFVNTGGGSSGITAVFQAAEITALAAYRFVQWYPVDDISIDITTFTGTGTVNAYYKSDKN